MDNVIILNYFYRFDLFFKVASFRLSCSYRLSDKSSCVILMIRIWNNRRQFNVCLILLFPWWTFWRETRVGVRCHICRQSVHMETRNPWNTPKPHQLHACYQNEIAVATTRANVAMSRKKISTRCEVTIVSSVLSMISLFIVYIDLNVLLIISSASSTHVHLFYELSMYLIRTFCLTALTHVNVDRQYVWNKIFDMIVCWYFVWKNCDNMHIVYRWYCVS